MSHRRKDTDYLAISARIRAMENRLLTRERMDRMIEARDDAEAMKLLAECGYQDAAGLDAALAQARAGVFKDMEQGAPDPRLVEVFQIKYDYHNAKTILKSQAVGNDPERLLLAGGRYDPGQLLDSWKREALSGVSETFRKAMEQAGAALTEGGDPQRADLILDRACYAEMARLADELKSPFLQGYVRLSVDVANLRAAVRVARMGREGDFLRQVLLPGGNVSETAISSARVEALGEVFRSGPLAKAAGLGEKLAQPGGGSLTAFERECDNALTAYLAAARRIPFGEETVIGYLYAKELEFTAIRAIFAGRAAGLDGDTIRSRLRETYV
ncbi:MAG: V-type ATPase subunit [Lawsonibacter sp.]|uniref:V-type ATPase subunit n=1 Tax=Lawsonibacter sp. JLR.KK007 TaxID=3114293 RepID=UPI00216E0463|nr:V-type ATPase subunit [uncultured Oscillibacter sp.]MCI8437544.1 V-type ATPase subunit [Lawsonibacter sp.]MCI8990143.1 V-type ATPase subunit [Lawsonibacter sp.]